MNTSTYEQDKTKANYANCIVIIPAYNEGKKIREIVSGLRQSYLGILVIVIDDGSSDNTFAESKAAGAIVLRHPFNMGYGASIQSGYKYALYNEYEYLVQMDGDGQHDLSDVGKLLDEVKSGTGDLILGSRYLDGQDYQGTLPRRLGTSFFRAMLNIMTGQKFTDPTTGFQAMNRNILTLFVKDSFPYDYPDADVIMFVSKVGLKIKEIPVRMYHFGDNNSMHSNPFKVGYYIFKMILSMVLVRIRTY